MPELRSIESHHSQTNHPGGSGIRPAVGPLVYTKPVIAHVSSSEEPRRPPLFRSGERLPPPIVPVILPPPDADTFFEASPEPAAMPPTVKKMLQRRRRAALAAFFVIAAAVLVVGQVVRRNDRLPVTTIAPAASALPPAYPPGGFSGPSRTAETSASERAGTTVEAGRPPADMADGTPTGSVGTKGAFTFVAGSGPVLGTAGTLRRFRVAVERTLGQGNGGDFADEVDRTLGDSRSWVASRRFRLQRVPAAAASEFTVYLASARTSTRMCAAGGLSTDGFTSCRLPGQVIINYHRWQDAVPDYGAPLETFRAYEINHEVGHQLGHGHQVCPGKGRPAPVMQQQMYGLQGCVANGWPYIDGKLYEGPPVG
jgi:uncharacterized protein DUF3152